MALYYRSEIIRRFCIIMSCQAMLPGRRTVVYVKCNMLASHIMTHYINKIQQDATVCRYLFTAKSLCMFRVSIAPIIRST